MANESRDEENKKCEGNCKHEQKNTFNYAIILILVTFFSFWLGMKLGEIRGQLYSTSSGYGFGPGMMFGGGSYGGGYGSNSFGPGMMFGGWGGNNTSGSSFGPGATQQSWGGDAQRGNFPNQNQPPQASNDSGALPQ